VDKNVSNFGVVKMIRKITIASVVFFLTSFAFAQNNNSNVTRSLSLQDCIKIALERNTSVLQSQYQAESQNAKVLSAYGGLLPSLSASGQFQYSYNQTQGVIVGGVYLPIITTSTQRRYGAGVSADYTLFNGFANYAAVNSAVSAGQAADHSYQRAKQTAVYQATQNYLAVFNARDQLKISQDNLKRDQQQLESIKEQNSVGSASLADVYQQQAVVSADEYALVQAQNAYDQAQAALKFYLGIPVTDSVTFADSTIKTEIDTTEFMRVNQEYNQYAGLLDKALELRPDYKAAIENLNSSKSSLSIAKAAYSPTISLFGQYGINGPQTSALNQNKSFYGGLTISLPIFNGFQTQSNIQTAGVAVKSSEQTLDATRRQVQLDVYQALLNLNAAEKQYEAGVNQVASAKINLETAQEKYRIGGATLLDVLTANAQYTQALSNQVNAAYNYIQAKQAMEYAIGTINY
jgi:outer membrane protein